LTLTAAATAIALVTAFTAFPAMAHNPQGMGNHDMKSQGMGMGKGMMGKHKGNMAEHRGKGMKGQCEDQDKMSEYRQEHRDEHKGEHMGKNMDKHKGNGRHNAR